MKRSAILALAFSTLAVSSSAFAQSNPRVTPQAVIVNPVQTALQVNVGVDRAGDNPIYNIGEKISINVSVSSPAVTSSCAVVRRAAFPRKERATNSALTVQRVKTSCWLWPASAN